MRGIVSRIDAAVVGLTAMRRLFAILSAISLVLLLALLAWRLGFYGHGFWFSDAERFGNPAPAVWFSYNFPANWQGFLPAHKSFGLPLFRHECPYPVALALTLVLPAIWIRQFLKHRKASRSGRCSECGYDLRATPDRCPECGTPVARK